ncbi:MAG: hypothetical protein WCQ47_04050 [bacterium]
MHKKFITLFIVTLIIANNVYASPKLCKTPSGRPVDCEVLEKIQRILVTKKMIQINRELKTQIASIKAAEKPTEQVRLAPVTSVNVPVQTASFTPVVQSEIKKQEEKSDFEKNFAAAIENAVSKTLKNNNDPLYNNMKSIFKYSLTDTISVKTEPSFSWKWTQSTDNSSSFMFNNLPLILNHSSLFYSPSMNLNIDGNFIISLPTNKYSIEAGVLSYIITNIGIKKDFHGGRGNIKFTPELVYAARKYTTTRPTSSTQEQFDALDPSKTIIINGGDGDQAYERLNPYDQFTTSFESNFFHQLIGGLSFCTWIKFINTKMYGDYINSGGTTYTVQPEAWINNFEFAQEIKYTVSNNFSVKTGISSIGQLSSYRPFSTQGNNNIVWWLTIKYDFYNKTDF